VKFLVDMPLSPDLAEWLQTEGHDAVHANELSMYQKGLIVGRYQNPHGA
jgi:predicted nuclease of predicted toxin-antitoxin system